MSGSLYNEKFYKSNRNSTIYSSELILNYIFKKIKYVPNDVIDIGCGTGEWLNSAYKIGVKNITGADGKWVKKNALVNKNIELINLDLNKDFERYNFKKYEFLICTEVIEHLSPSINDIFIKKLCELSDIILFSGAIPGQKGTNHINCQWQSYWHQKFSKNNYNCYDIIRPYIWNNFKVDFWLKQNLLIFINKDSTIKNDLNDNDQYIDIIHPEFLNIGIKRSLDYLFKSLLKKIL